MRFGIARLSYFFALFALVWITAYGKRHPTSARPSKKSLTTGRLFNQPDTLAVVPVKGESPIPGMIYVEGGYMIMGNLSEDKLGTGGCCAKPVTVTSFYMDQTPITNLDYREYLDDLRKSGLMEAYNAAMPNQKVFVEDFSYNDPLTDQDSYFNMPDFMYYPVVGVSWEQATAYCKWRTKKIQELIKQKGKGKGKAGSAGQTDTGYVSDEDQKKPVDQDNSEPIVQGLPVVRLATEAEWEYAARGIVGTVSIDYLQRHQRTYPWDGSSPRGKNGQFLANFKRGRGNYKGVTGASDHAAPTSYVYAYPPNDLGLYDMVGNVCCWVSDTYRPLSLQDTSDLNPIRRDGRLDPASSYNATDKVSLINDDARVYKGCSWADSAYFLQIGTRRYLNKDAASARIGFRCVVSSLGR